MLNFPIYLLGSSYYLHTRIAGKQVKKSLRTAYRREAIIRAVSILNGLRMSTPPTKYELDLSKGILKSDWSCPNSPDTLTFLNKVIGFNDIGI